MTHMDVTGIARGGLETAHGMLEKSATLIGNAAYSQSDLTAGVVELLSAEEQFQAHAQVIQVGHQMQKTLLDRLA
jgi:flagellar hook protein FlgE